MTVIGPGVTPDLMWQGPAPGPYSASADADGERRDRGARTTTSAGRTERPRLSRRATLAVMPFFICPRCKNREFDSDGREGITQEPPSCHQCDFGFMFQLLEDYYPAQATGFVVCDQEGRILASGRGIFELSGFEEPDLMGRDVAEAFGLSDPSPIATVREWGVRQLGKELSMRTHAGLEKKVIADFFPAYDDDGGLLVALTPD